MDIVNWRKILKEGHLGAEVLFYFFALIKAFTNSKGKKKNRTISSLFLYLCRNLYIDVVSIKVMPTSFSL